MYDGATIKKGKTMTTGVVNAVKDPSSGRITTHFRELGIVEMVNTDAGSSFKAVASTLRNAAVLDSSTTENLDILESTKDVLSKVDYVVTDLGGEMRPVANKFSDFKVSLGHTSRPTYIHCNAHISPAFDAEIDKELYAIEQLLDLKSYVDKGFNSSFLALIVHALTLCCTHCLACLAHPYTDKKSNPGRAKKISTNFLRLPISH